jgi:hypothetical protein
LHFLHSEDNLTVRSITASGTVTTLAPYPFAKLGPLAVMGTQLIAGNPDAAADTCGVVAGPIATGVLTPWSKDDTFCSLCPDDDASIDALASDGTHLYAANGGRVFQLHANAMPTPLINDCMDDGHWFPAGGEALGLRGVALLVAVLVNGVLGALMTLGFGLYAPCMILVGLLGMNLKAAFPIMMSSCALLMPVGSLRFFQTADEPRVPAYAPRAAMGLTVGGIPAVLVAALLVRSLPLDAVRWLVVVVVTLTAVTMLRAARR